MTKSVLLLCSIIIGLSLIHISCEKKDPDIIEPPPSINPNNNDSTILKDTRDGHKYKILEIGDKVWMAENLYFNTSPGSWIYGNNQSIGEYYGRLYNWQVACNICPADWHLPSDEEWKELEIYLGMEQAEADLYGLRGTDEGNKLRTSSGLAFLLGGFVDIQGFHDRDSLGFFWTATKQNSDSAIYRKLLSSDARVERGYHNKSKGFSVRCVRDNK